MTTQQLRLDGTLQLPLTPEMSVAPHDARVAVQLGEAVCRCGQWAVVVVRGTDGIYTPHCKKHDR